MTSKDETVARLKERVAEREQVALEEILAEDLPDNEEEALVKELDEKEGREIEEEETAEPKSSTREYLVLCQKPKREEWLIVDRKVSSTAEGAIRSLGEEVLEDGATYAAVPARNWSQLPPVAKRTITTISFS